MIIFKKYTSILLGIFFSLLLLGGCSNRLEGSITSILIPSEKLKSFVTAPDIASQIITPGDLLEILYFKKYDDQSDYFFDIKDIIQIDFIEHPELSTQLVIKPDGKISLQRIGEVLAKGLNTNQLNAILTEEYSHTIPSPSINIIAVSTNAKRDEFFDTLANSVNGTSKIVRVRKDGKVSLPLIGNIVVTGMTIDKIHSLLNKKYSNLFNNIDITIDIKEKVSQRFTVLGEVKKPGTFPLINNMSHFEALAAAGGLLNTAYTDSVLLLRHTAKGIKVSRINMNTYVTDGNYILSSLVHSKDILYIPKTSIADINKFVDQYIRRLLPFTVGTGAYYSLN